MVLCWRCRGTARANEILVLETLMVLARFNVSQCRICSRFISLLLFSVIFLSSIINSAALDLQSLNAVSQSRGIDQVPKLASQQEIASRNDVRTMSSSREESEELESVRDLRSRRESQEPHDVTISRLRQIHMKLLRKQREQEFSEKLKSRAALQFIETFPIEGPKRNLLLVSTPRSGSTMFLELFSIIKDAFALPEPYAMFENSTIVRSGDFGHKSSIDSAKRKSVTVPTLKSLYDCSFLDSEGSFQRVLWKYTCDYAPWIVRNLTLENKCIQFSLTKEDVEPLCKSSSFTVIKIVRTPFLDRHFGSHQDLASLASFVHVIHLVRAPWDIFVSRNRAGWEWYSGGEEENLDRSETTAGLERICSHMISDVTFVQRFSKSMIVRYEDLVFDFETWFRKILLFVNVTGEERMVSEGQKIMQTQFVKFRAIVMMDNKYQFEARRNLIKKISLEVPECSTIAHTFGYV